MVLILRRSRLKQIRLIMLLGNYLIQFLFLGIYEHINHQLLIQNVLAYDLAFIGMLADGAKTSAYFDIDLC